MKLLKYKASIKHILHLPEANECTDKGNCPATEVLCLLEPPTRITEGSFFFFFFLRKKIFASKRSYFNPLWKALSEKFFFFFFSQVKHFLFRVYLW